MFTITVSLDVKIKPEIHPHYGTLLLVSRQKPSCVMLIIPQFSIGSWQRTTVDSFRMVIQEGGISLLCKYQS